LAGTSKAKYSDNTKKTETINEKYWHIAKLNLMKQKPASGCLFITSSGQETIHSCRGTASA